MSNLDDEFNELISSIAPDLDDDVVEADVDGVGAAQTPIDPVDAAQLLAADDLLLDLISEWHIDDDALVITAKAPQFLLVQAVIEYLLDEHTSWDPMACLDVPEGDLRRDALAARHDELASATTSGLAAAKDLCEGRVPLAGLFDASRGFQAARLALHTERVSLVDALNGVGALAPGVDELPEELVHATIAMCGGLSGDVITLALEHDT